MADSKGVSLSLLRRKPDTVISQRKEPISARREQSRLLTCDTFSRSTMKCVVLFTSQISITFLSRLFWPEKTPEKIQPIKSTFRIGGIRKKLICGVDILT